MEFAIVAILFILLSLNPAMALAYWVSGFSFKNERNIKIVKIIQLVNGILSIVVFALTIALFDDIATGGTIKW